MYNLNADLNGKRVELTTIFGRLVAILRALAGHTQGSFAQLLCVDRSLLARIETGRNMATLDHILLIESKLRELGRISGPGHLVSLCNAVAVSIIQRGGNVAYRKDPAGLPAQVSIPTAALDVVVSQVLGVASTPQP